MILICINRTKLTSFSHTISCFCALSLLRYSPEHRCNHLSHSQILTEIYVTTQQSPKKFNQETLFKINRGQEWVLPSLLGAYTACLKESSPYEGEKLQLRKHILSGDTASWLVSLKHIYMRHDVLAFTPRTCATRHSLSG